MAEKSPTLTEWRKLYGVALQVKELAPWEWMMEDDLFGVQNPETGELGFVSVMGALGEHLAVAVYLGAAALHNFLEVEDSENEIEPQRVMEIPQLQASFEDRGELRQEDRQIIKRLGLKFRGRQAWPLFRSYGPGLMPWFLTAAEARFLTCALEQLLDVAPRFENDELLLWPEGEDEFLVRVPQPKEGELIWEDKIMPVPQPEPTFVPLQMDFEALERAKGLPHPDREIEVDLVMLPIPIAEKKERPFLPYLLLIVDGPSKMIVGTEMLQPRPSLEAMWGEVPLNLISTLLRLNFIPSIVRVRSELLIRLLQQLSVELGFQLKQSRELSGVDKAMDFMMHMFQ